jgi:hypothetical protein
MDVTVLEAAVSHFLPFTSPLSKFSAGCFSSCKFQVKNNSCKCNEYKKNFVTNYIENASKYTSEIVMEFPCPEKHILSLSIITIQDYNIILYS